MLYPYAKTSTLVLNLLRVSAGMVVAAAAASVNDDEDDGAAGVAEAFETSVDPSGSVVLALIQTLPRALAVHSEAKGKDEGEDDDDWGGAGVRKSDP